MSRKAVLLFVVLAAASPLFGADEGRIVVTNTADGAEVIMMKAPGGTASVSLFGARILSYRPTGGEEVLFRPRQLVLEGEDWQHGGIPLCWPWFSDNAGASLVCHGFARFSRFRIRSRRVTERTTELVLRLESSDETRRLWPYDFDLDYRIVLSDSLRLVVTTRNVGVRRFKLTSGLHPYFRLGERNRAWVDGADGAPVCNAICTLGPDRKESAFTGSWKGAIVLTNAYDHVFSLSEQRYSVVDPSLMRRISVSSVGTCKLVVWNPDANPPFDIGNLSRDDWRRFVCAEPATTFADRALTIEPDGTHVMDVTIAVKPFPSHRR